VRDGLLTREILEEIITPGFYLGQLLARLHAHDELAAEGLEAVWSEAQDDVPWQEGMGLYDKTVQDLTDAAELILGAYEEV
jgi:hypothetical protein